MEVEISILKSEVTKSSCWLLATLYPALHSSILALLTNINVLIFWELFLKSFLLFWIVGIMDFIQYLKINCFIIFHFYQVCYRVTCISDVHFVTLKY